MVKAASFLSSLLGGGGRCTGGRPSSYGGVDPDIPDQVLQGVSVPQAPVTSFGFKWDRQWLVVNAKGRAWTQRVEPKMALVQVELPPEAFDEDCSQRRTPAWVPTVDQERGIFGTEPTETMLTFRSGEVIRPSHKNKQKVYFGQNLVCKESVSAKGKGRIVKVGDPVYVLQTYTSSNEAPA
ncbi:hypothetical protein ACQ4PT_021253 [Festuca glaucescens]